MADIVAERKVPAVFIESTINPRTVQSVIDATAQRGHR
jgi:manganese/zinc/iron transport system substrate-binding protein